MLIMSGNIKIYLHPAMIFTQKNRISHNIRCAIFRICYPF